MATIDVICWGVVGFVAGILTGIGIAIVLMALGREDD